MKITVQIGLLLIINLLLSCKSKSLFEIENFSYREEIRDSILLHTQSKIEGKFVYSEFDSILIKGRKEDFDKEIKMLIDSVNGKLYKEAYQKIDNIISNQFEKSDSVNLDSVKTSKLIIYPIYGIAKSEKLFVRDKRMKKPESKIWEKDFYGESIFRDSIRTRFYEGKIYSTRNGNNILRVELKSGH